MERIAGRFAAFLAAAIFSLMIVSCPTPGPSVIYDGDFMMEAGNITPVPYMNIIENKIYMTSVTQEFSLNDKSSWADCNGSVVSTSFTIGDRVWVREKSAPATEWFPGEVLAASGRPDITPSDELYIGIYDPPYWDDMPLMTAGQTRTVLFSIYNMGDTGTTAAGHRVWFYISVDRVITSDDHLIYDDVISNLPVGRIPSANWCLFDFKVPALDPGVYHLGMIVDAAEVVTELNEDNNATTADNVVEITIRDPNGNGRGAFKIVNSWGKGTSGWENVADGHYWLTFDALLALKPLVFYYYNTTSPAYKPTVLAVFNITHSDRSLCKLTLGLGSPDNPFIKKEFQASIWGILQSGALDFPGNDMALDISEFANYLNEYDLYLRVDNTSGSVGTLNSFSVELYTNYDNPVDEVFTWSGAGGVSALQTIDFTIATAGNVTTNISQIIPNARAAAAGIVFLEEKATEEELARDLLLLRTASGTLTGSGRYRGFGTGLRPPTEDELRGAMKLRAIKTLSAARNTQVDQSVDLSLTQYFPPIGNQGSEGSCAAFAFGYYVHTYTMAREFGWDLSTTTWTDPPGTDPGFPTTNQDRIFSPDFIYHQANSGGDNGSSLFAVGSLLARMGGAVWDLMPYDVSDSTTWPSEAAFRGAARYRAREAVDGYWSDIMVGYFTILKDADINLLKNLLANGYCATMGIRVDDDGSYDGLYEYLDANDVIDYHSELKPVVMDHAQTIVGFKDGTVWNKADPEN